MQDNKSIECPARDVRILKIEAVGDFGKGKTKPKIRLVGRWLEQAGFRSGHRVYVICTRPGILELRFVESAVAGIQQLPQSEPEIPF